ncbi:hypothetical protein OG474_09615 [Kribbella sp. NBC_01505]|uniref:hypothetical protein n=1 Tax=Kribbella sp. NBC_01505 TaxID=2903580 RepID=UPI003867A9C6
MPDAPATPATPATPAVTPEATATPATPATPAAPAAEATPAVVFDGPYDEDRAKKKIEAQADDLKKAREKLAAFEAAEKTRAEAEMTELQRVQARADAAEKALAAATAQTLVATLAAEFGVPAVLLTAADEAGLRAQAEAIKALLPAGTPAATPPGRPAPAATPGTGGAPATPLDAAAMADRIRSI